MQCIVFNSPKKSRTEYRFVDSIKYEHFISKKSNEEWNNAAIIIPAVCSSSNGTCDIIQLKYCLVLNFDLKNFSSSTDLEIPVVIGTIPMRSENPAIQNNFSYESDTFGNNPVAISWRDDDDGKERDVVESDVSSYKPFYPFYRNITK